MDKFHFQITEGDDTIDVSIGIPYEAMYERRHYPLFGGGMSMCIRRVEHWIENCDIAMLSAYRGELTKSENQARNAELLRKLQQVSNNGYGIFSVKGVYREEGKEQPCLEHSFFVTNLKKEAGFRERIFALAKEYDQDSFLYKLRHEDSAYLCGTSDSFYKGYEGVDKLGSFRVVVDKEEADTLAYKTIVKNKTVSFG